MKGTWALTCMLAMVAGLFARERAMPQSVMPIITKGQCVCGIDERQSNVIHIFNKTSLTISVEVYLSQGLLPQVSLDPNFCACVNVGLNERGDAQDIKLITVTYNGRPYTFENSGVLNYWPPRAHKFYQRGRLPGAVGAMPPRQFVIVDLHDGNPPPELRDADWQAVKERLSSDGIDLEKFGDVLALSNHYKNGFFWDNDARIAVRRLPQ